MDDGWGRREGECPQRTSQQHLVVGGGELAVVRYDGRPRNTPVQQGLDYLGFQHPDFQFKRRPRLVVELLTAAHEMPSH